MDYNTRLPQHASPVFSDLESHFLRHYASTLDRQKAMIRSGLAAHLNLHPTDALSLEREAGRVIRRAEQLDLVEIASHLGADRIAFVQRIWEICLDPEPHRAAKGLMIMARLHGLYADKTGGKASIALLLHPPAASLPATPPGLPFTIDLKPEGKQ